MVAGWCCICVSWRLACQHEKSKVPSPHASSATCLYAHLFRARQTIFELLDCGRDQRTDSVDHLFEMMPRHRESCLKMTAREVLLFLRQTAHFVVALGLAKLEERITVMLLKWSHVGAHVCCPGKEDGPTRLLLQLVDVLQEWICGRARSILVAFCLRP